MTVATCSNLFLCHWQLLATGNTNLPFNQVDSRNHFSNGVLHLQARVHFQEEEVVILINEFNSSCVVVANCLRCFNGCFAHCFFHTIRESWCWCFFNQFLVTTLCRAVACRHPHHVAVLIANELHFDVARPGEVALNINFVATKECFRLALRRIHCFLHLVCRLHHFHAASTATECSLDGYWPTELISEVGDFFCRGNELGGARNNWCTAAKRCFA